MSYRLQDEPRPGAWSHLVVNPLWPLFAVMFGGAAVSWIWFAWNGIAVGSPTRRREIFWVLGGFAGSLGVLLVILSLAAAEVIEGAGVRYALLALTVWKLFVSYWLFTIQSRSFHLYEHFGGVVRNGFFVVVVAFFLVNRIAGDLPAFWVLWLR